MILGIDPGKTTGVALVTDEGELKEKFNADFDQLKMLLQHDKLVELVDLVVMEQFVLYRNKAYQQTGSKMPASKAIGMVELWASMHNKPIEYQMPSILPIAMKYSKVRPKGAHGDNHWVDAFNHAFYYLVTKGKVQVVRHT